MESNSQNSIEWFARNRIVTANDLRFRIDNDTIVVLLRPEPFVKSFLGNLFLNSVLILFASVAVFRIDQIAGQALFLFVVAIAAYVYSERIRISVELDRSTFVTESRHFGYTTWITRVPFRNAQFIAKPVGGFQNIEDELVFSDGAQSHFCFYVTNPSEFGQALRDINTVIADRTIATTQFE